MRFEISICQRTIMLFTIYTNIIHLSIFLLLLFSTGFTLLCPNSFMESISSDHETGITNHFLTCMAVSDILDICSEGQTGGKKMPKKIPGREFGKFAREQLLRKFEGTWGNYKQLAGISLFEFSDGNKFLTLYASLIDNKWFYGVSEQYWENWDEKTYMVFLLGDGSRCDYVILNPKESQNLLRRIQPARTKQKKINIRIPSLGKDYIQEWPDFPLAQRVISLGTIETESGILKLKMNKHKTDLDTDKLMKTFQSLSVSEQKAMIEELKKMS